MKRNLIFLCSLLVISVPLVSNASAQVQTRVRIIEASNVGSNIDSSLRDVTGQIGSLFSFSSYRLLKEETVTLQKDQPVSIPTHPGRSLELTLIRQHREGAEVRVKIKREGSDVLNTQVRLTPGRTVSIGGPKHGQGTIIIALALL